MVTPRDCTCEDCVDACKAAPGWFAPGEAEKAAELLGMPFEDFKNEYLIVEYWVGGARVWSPRKDYQPKGGQDALWADAFKKGRCVFLDENDRCKIHAAKPYACREALLCEDPRDRRKEVSDKWIEAGEPLG